MRWRPDYHCFAVSTGVNSRDTMKSVFPQELALGRAAAGALRLRRARRAKCSGSSRPSSCRSYPAPGPCRLHGSPIKHAIAFRAETVCDPLVGNTGRHPQFGTRYPKGPVVDTARSRLGAGRQQQGKQKNRRTHSSPGHINVRAKLAQLAPSLKNVCCHVITPRPLRCRRSQTPRSPVEDKSADGILSALG